MQTGTMSRDSGDERDIRRSRDYWELMACWWNKCSMLHWATIPWNVGGQKQPWTIRKALTRVHKYWNASQSKPETWKRIVSIQLEWGSGDSVHWFLWNRFNTTSQYHLAKRIKCLNGLSVLVVFSKPPPVDSFLHTALTNSKLSLLSPFSQTSWPCLTSKYVSLPLCAFFLFSTQCMDILEFHFRAHRSRATLIHIRVYIDTYIYVYIHSDSACARRHSMYVMRVCSLLGIDGAHGLPYIRLAALPGTHARRRERDTVIEERFSTKNPLPNHYRPALYIHACMPAYLWA